MIHHLDDTIASLCSNTKCAIAVIFGTTLIP